MASTKGMKIAGWVLSGLLGVMLIGVSASTKFIDFKDKAEMYNKLGVTDSLMRTIGIVEIAITVLFLVPQTSFVGAILLTGYLGGATMTHARVNESIVMPIVIGVLVWVALGLRRSEVFSMAIGTPRQKPT